MKPGDHHEALDRCERCADTTLHEYRLIYVETLHEALTRCGIELYGPATMRTRTWERRCMGCNARRAAGPVSSASAQPSAGGQ